MIAQKRVLSALLGLVFGLLPCLPASAQDAGSSDAAVLDYYTTKAARIQEMRANMPTQAQREAAAAELAATKLRLEQARKAAVKAGVMTPEQAQVPPGVAPPAPGSIPDYFTTSNWAFSPPLRKFVDGLPGLTAAGANNLGNYIPVANPDSITYPGSDYYEIELIEYSQQFHSDLPATQKLRGYHQTNFGTDSLGHNTIAPDAAAHWLGPIIVATRDRPVRIKFTNNLPIGAGGDLVLPVDESIMGSGKGPLFANGTACDPTPIASIPPGNATPGQACAHYTQNRSTIHLHGGRTPWISDGTPHQWIIPAGEWANTPYKEGVSLENVPDMPNPGPGSTTYYYSNQQSARLMFYHEHAWGITRLNVIMGVAAGYLITDQFEQDLVTQKALPADQIPLVLQDRSFIASDVRVNDPTWNYGSGAPDANGVRPVVVGDFWLPHVYVPAQNPYDPTGVNPYGRWVYGPWFFPPTTNILWSTVPNPYHDPACSDPDPLVFAFCTTPGQPPVIPGTPLPSVGAETFFDTSIVNGQAFPSVTLLPKAYRFRILNAANDRFQNLNWYKADPAQVSVDGRLNTEVKMLPAALGQWDVNLYPDWPTDGRVEGVPDPTTAGPSWIHIGTEGGFNPRPTVIGPQPMTWVTDPTAFNVGNIDLFGLFLGPAERADVVVDFSPYAGQTLILYNDAPAAVPAFDPRHDYLANAPDLSANGGYGRPAPTFVNGVLDPMPATGPLTGPAVGFGPNTRTVMQVKVAAGPVAAPFDLAKLQAAFAPAPGKPGVFESAQDSIIVGQDAYNGIYSGVTFPKVWPYWGFSRIQDTTLNVFTVGGQYITFPMEPKGMHDEMGASFDMEYGRMSANLGMTNPSPVVGLLNLTIYKYIDPSTEILNDAMVPLSPVLGDGTQIWKISHNGVDMHPIHFHIFDVQVINRVGWDGQIRPPHPTELGWKDTVRIAPLEDTIVAMRPWAPKLPFGQPSSLRPLNPAFPLNSPFGFTNIDPVTQQAKVPPDVNVVTNFGHEYVWHCHILSHEENDMMRPIILNVISTVPGSTTLSPITVAYNAQGKPVISWIDPTPVDYIAQVNFGNPANEIGFTIERSPGVGLPFAPVGTAIANATSFTDTTAGAVGTFYRYRVVTFNDVGSSVSGTADIGTPPVIAKATRVDLLASRPSPYLRTLPGVAVNFTATAQGGPIGGLYEYRFWRSLNGGAFVEVQAYSASNVYTLPVTTPAGTYQIKVDARTSSASPVDVTSPTVTFVIQVPAPATVTLTADPLLPSPGFFGVPVTFTAVGAGSVGYEYQFWLSNGTGFGTVPVQAWSAVATYVLPATMQPGDYQVKVEVRTTGSNVDATATVPYTIRYYPATTLTLRPSVTSPFIRNIVPGPVSFLATGGGSPGTPQPLGYKYRYSLSTDGVNFTEVQAFSTNRVWNLPTVTAAGTYTVKVEVSTALVPVVGDLATQFALVVQDAPAATGVLLSPSLPSPQLAGVPVTFTALGQNSSGYYYRFLFGPVGGPLVETQPFGPLATWTMPGTTAVGDYQVVAEVRSSPTSVAAEATRTLNYTVGLGPPSPATGANVTATPASPSLPGTSVVFQATGLGSIQGGQPTAQSVYQFRFFLNTGAGWTMVQDYGLGSAYTLATPVIGTYQVAVHVRTSSLSAGDYFGPPMTHVVSTAPTAATAVAIATNATNPSAPGANVVFTATGSGSIQNGAASPASAYDYQFWLNSGAGWTMVRNYGGGPSYTLTAPVVGTYQVLAYTRTSALVASDAFTVFTQQVAVPPTPATGGAIVASPGSPSLPGTAVQFTATGLGSTTNGQPSPQSAYQFRFFVNAGAGYTMVQDYGVGATYTMPAPAAGTYLVAVHVRTSSLVAVDFTGPPITHLVAIPTTPATGVDVVPTLTSPSTPGASVTFNATGLGSLQNGLPSPQSAYQFKFFVDSGAGWSMVQDYGVGSSYTLATPTSATYRVAVHVRTSPLVAADYFGPPQTHVVGVITTPATGVQVTAAPTSPSTPGTSVVFSATGLGSTQGGLPSPQTAYDFRFFLNTGTGWVLVKDYGLGASYTLVNPIAGSYQVAVHTRTSAQVPADFYGAPVLHTVQ